MSCLFVGGLRDGDWFQVPDDREFWTMRERPSMPRVTWPPPDVVEPSMIRQETYKRIKFRGLHEIYSVFASQGFTPDDVLLNLLKNYQAKEPSEARNKKLSEVSQATVDAKLLGCGFLMIFPDNSFMRISPDRISLRPEQPVNGSA